MRHEFRNYTTIEEYLLAKSRVNEETPIVEGVHCRDWTGSFKGDYGRTCNVDGQRWKAHRLSCLTFNGEFPPDKPNALHRCNRPSCIEPKHLYAGDQADNMRDRKISGYVKSPLTAEVKAKISASVSATMTPEHRERLSVAVAGFKHTPEAREKIRLANEARRSG